VAESMEALNAMRGMAGCMARTIASAGPARRP
jgi:hypothetical protein